MEGIKINSLIKTVEKSDKLKKLIDTIKKSGLIREIEENGPYTIFAPSDEAFKKAEQSTDSLYGDIDNLSRVLTYHFVPGKVMYDEVKHLQSVKTLLGQEIHFYKKPGTKVKVNGANIIEKNIECSNGVIHLIDEILCPNIEKPKEDELYS